MQRQRLHREAASREGNKVKKYRCFRRRKRVKRRTMWQETKQRESKSAKEREAKESGNEPEEIKLEKEKLSD